MYNSEALMQYEYALKMGVKYYNNCVAKGENPYPLVLDEFFSEDDCAGRSYLGLVEIPAEKIVGTTTAGRKSAFAGNFMPLLDVDSEFASKWVNLCSAHLDTVGITDPIVCSEYMGKFYITEGNKRVSVLKSYGAATVPGIVTRLIPVYDEQDVNVQVYYEFMNFYQLSRLYDVSFRRPGGFTRLPAALGYAPDYHWTEEDRRDFRAAYRKLRPAFEKLNTENLPLEAGDALLAWLAVYPLAELETISEAELHKRLTALWPELRALVNDNPIAVSTDPAEAAEKRGILHDLLGIGRINHLNIAFVHSFDPARSAWTAAHELGREHLIEELGDKVTVTSHVCSVAEATDLMEQLVKDGTQVIFTTTPPLIDACRKIAAAYPQVRMLNCSLTMPYPSVRTYYSRMYEGKFIAGAIAGAMAEEDCIGYIANYPIAGTLAAINAFALGVRMTNPRARISLKWSCLPGDHVGDLMEERVSVISNRDNAAGESLYAWEWGTYHVGKDGQLSPLASPCWNWGEMYEKIVDSIFNGSWAAEGGKDAGQAVNYWWGMSSGVVGVELSDTLPAGIRQMAEILKKGLEAGSIDPFRCEIRDRAGVIRNDGTASFTPEEIMTMDWLCDNVDGSIPAFEEILPASRPLVRQLGLNRDQLPPETEVAP